MVEILGAWQTSLAACTLSVWLNRQVFSVDLKVLVASESAAVTMFSRVPDCKSSAVESSSQESNLVEWYRQQQNFGGAQRCTVMKWLRCAGVSQGGS